MSDRAKSSDLKGMFKRDTPVSIEEMNEAIREQGAAAGLIGPEDGDIASVDAQAGGETQHSIADMLNDNEGNNIEFVPPKLDVKFKPPKI